MSRSRLPELSPLVQSWLRVRLKKVTYPSCKVRSSAGRFMNPTIKTSPSDESWTTAGSSPFILLKSNSVFIQLCSSHSKNKKPAERYRVSGLKLYKIGRASCREGVESE